MTSSRCIFYNISSFDSNLMKSTRYLTKSSDIFTLFFEHRSVAFPHFGLFHMFGSINSPLTTLWRFAVPNVDSRSGVDECCRCSLNFWSSSSTFKLFCSQWPLSYGIHHNFRIFLHQSRFSFRLLGLGYFLQRSTINYGSLDSHVTTRLLIKGIIKDTTVSM